ncbi:hypothetical protein Taro_016381 [Colocasia esculenta]|uniref:Uncharacterized protein n=1 Tax=Colocasia esculenta TaxID=4460 RepID=A0A843UQ14_COLES|nr:hypothetical protein [Colocasia esculenta]
MCGAAAVAVQRGSGAGPPVIPLAGPHSTIALALVCPRAPTSLSDPPSSRHWTARGGVRNPAVSCSFGCPPREEHILLVEESGIAAVLPSMFPVGVDAAGSMESLIAKFLPVARFPVPDVGHAVLRLFTFLLLSLLPGWCWLVWYSIQGRWMASRKVGRAGGEVIEESLIRGADSWGIGLFGHGSLNFSHQVFTPEHCFEYHV